MANPNPKPPPKHSRFKKGQSGNPLGGKLANPEMRAIRNLTEAEMVNIGSLILKGSIKDLQAIAKDPNSTVLQAMMAAVAVKTMQKGDAQALDVLLNRLIGKVKERVEVTGNALAPLVVVSLPSNGREVKEIGSGSDSGKN